PTGYCPDACTPDNGPYPAEVTSGEKIAPMPAAPIPRAPRRLFMGLFQRSKPVDGADTSTSSEMPKADTQKPDPLKNPAAYCPSGTAAELAGVPAAAKSDTPFMANGKTPLGASSVLQAGNPRYVPVPIVTLPDRRRPPQPPMAQAPLALHPNQPDLNAFT